MKAWMKICGLLLVMMLFCIVGTMAENAGVQPAKDVLIVKTTENEYMSSLNQPIDVPGIGTVTVLRCDKLTRGDESTPIRVSFMVFNTTTTAMNYRDKNIPAADLIYANNVSFEGKVYQCVNREKLDVYDIITDYGNPASKEIPVLQIGYYYIEYNVPNAVIDMPGSIVPCFTTGNTEFVYGFREYSETNNPEMTEGMLIITNPEFAFEPLTLNTPISIPRVGTLTVLRCDVGSKGSETTPINLSIMITNTTEGEKNYRDNVIRRRNLVFADIYNFDGNVYQCSDKEKLDTYSYITNYGTPVSKGVPTLQNGYFFIQYDVANAVLEMPGSIIISFYLSDTKVTYCFRQ